MGLFFSLMVFGWGWMRQPQVEPLAWIGLILYAPAALLLIGSFVCLKTRGKPDKGWEETKSVVDTGVYRVTRHPMFLGSAMWTAASLLIIQSYAATALGLPAILFFLLASKLEESHNLKKFGEAYRTYMNGSRTWSFHVRPRKPAR